MPGFMDSLEGDEYFIEVADFRLSVEKNFQLNKEDILGSEKHISVDPSSLRESANSKLVMYPVPTQAGKFDALHLPPLHPPSKPFLSYSLPNSISSSPKFGSMLPRKKPRNLNQVSALSFNSFSLQDSIALANLERLRGNHMRRSKSCGEGRTTAPPEDFDPLMAKPRSVKHDHHSHSKIGYEDQVEQNKSYIDETTVDPYDEKVSKCGALCLFLPGFSKAAKPVRARKEEPPETIRYWEPENQELVVSKRVSLEKFECSSWRSSVMLDDCENQKDISNLFYDLPLELIRGNVSDTHSPVTTAFVFDKDRRGVLKKSSSRTATTKSPDSFRHVRFSTSTLASSPAFPTSCIKVDDPLHKARVELNSFIAAQSA